MARELRVRTELLGWALVLIVYSAVALVLLVLELVAAVLVVVWVGLPLLLVLDAGIRGLADAHRRFAARLSRRPVSQAYLPSSGGGLLHRVAELARDRSRWRDLGWLFVAGTAGLALSIVAVLDCLLGLLFWWVPRSIMLRLYAALTRLLLAPSEKAQLALRVQQLTVSRAASVDSSAAELRRIERDLHDGAQARLVAVGISLGMAEEQLDQDPSLARTLLAEARAANTQALAELRDLVRGVHPPVLADRGLVGAVQALALTGPFPVQVSSTVSTRLPAPVESAMYFSIAEGLTNLIKHSGAQSADIAIDLIDGVLVARISDDGVGGADPSQGSGLRGIERRLSAFDGRLDVTSPTGGPTVLEVHLPCG